MINVIIIVFGFPILVKATLLPGLQKQLMPYHEMLKEMKDAARRKKNLVLHATFHRKENEEIKGKSGILLFSEIQANKIQPGKIK
jgi:hypothetical protein